MSWQELAASLVDSLAWPVSIAIVVIVLRKQLTAMLDVPMKRVKAGPFELEMQETARDVVEAVVQAEPLELRPASEYDEQIAYAAQLANTVPVVAVRHAWSLVDRRLREIAAEGGVPAPPDLSPLVLTRALVQRNLISSESKHAIDGLALLYETARHDDGRGRSVSAEQAGDYVQYVRGVLYALSFTPARAEP